ncbi:MAG TPA: DinB family protein [Verrucomicrobiae bacterium]|nr:DinB family protein [Bryobacteraceae bacterium]HXU19131.1 DinB family protein [Verrucomicrobiae bacterium]
MSEISDLLERFRGGPELVADTIAGATDAELDFAPAPGKWTMRQIVAHLADTELVMAARFRRMIAEDRPRFEEFDQDAWAQSLDYSKRLPAQSIETLTLIRGDNYALLKDISEAAFERTGVHPRRGEMSVLQLVKLSADHVEKHSGHLRERREQWRRRS